MRRQSVVEVPAWAKATLVILGIGGWHAPLLAADPARAEIADTTGEAAGHVRRLPSLMRFGAAVAVVGDEVLIGRPGRSARRGSAAGLDGGVHVFRRRGQDGWREVAVLVPEHSVAGEDFGAALAVDSTADGVVLAVGAPLAEGGGGAVYLFDRLPDGRWAARARVTVAGSTPGDGFGRVVALRAGTLLVGAPERARERGGVAVFRRGATTRAWSQQALLTSADTTVRGLGRALAFAAGRLVIGAPGPAPAGGIGVPRPPPAIAQVLVFRDSAGVWARDTSLVPSDGGPGPRRPGESRFGIALFGSGTELWIGDPARGSGVVHRFQADTAGRWREVGPIEAASGATQFGLALARAGRDRLVGGSDGAIFVLRYDTAAGDWREVQQVTPAKPGADSTATPLRIEEIPGWFAEPLALAAGDSVAVLGAVWTDVLEGSALVLERAGVQGAWHPAGLVVDTAWSTRQPLTGGPFPCRQGYVRVFPCHDVDLLAFLPRAAIGGGHGVVINDLWGWTDSASGREFALVGHTNGTAFIEVTTPTRPRYLGTLPFHQPGGTPSEWRDIKVYRSYAFIVSEGGDHGMQVFDLTQLLAVKDGPRTFAETAHYDGIASAHNIVADTATGFVYVVGSGGRGQTCGGGLHMIDVHHPTTPVFAGCYSEPQAGNGYVHDAQCVVYRGPDRAYQGHEICLASTGNGLAIADVTDKAHPATLSIARYPRVSYTHQGWFTDDQRYFFVDDELDEYAFKNKDSVRTRTMVFDLRELGDPVLVTEFLGTTGATDHNLFVRGPLVFQSNYTAGLRVLDGRDPPHLREVGYFDTAPAFSDSPRPGMPRMSEGSWSNYPYFKHGVVAVTSMSEGFYLVRYRGAP